MTEPRETAPMRPENVPDDLVDLAWRADTARRAPTASAEAVAAFCDGLSPDLAESYRDTLRPVLAAVLPAIEAMVRAKVAEEIEADVEPFFAARLEPGMWEAAYRAARIARGEQP